MDPNKIQLDNLSKSFEYFKLATEIDQLESVEELRNLAKAYIKLYFKQQETLLNMGIPNSI